MGMAQKNLKNTKKTEHPGKRYLSLAIAVLLLYSTIFFVGTTLLAQNRQYTSNYWKRFPELKKTYLDSQYVNKHPKGWVPDEWINAYAGGAYMQGTSPILIAPDTPPFGRYLIGVSAMLFQNENIVVLLSTILSLVFLYLIGRQTSLSWISSLALVAFVSAEPIFENQLVYTPLLDIMQLLFLLVSFYSFNRGNGSRKHLLFFALASLFLGFFIATKFFATGITVLGAYGLVLLLHKDKQRIVSFFFTIPIAIAVLLLSYVRELVLHHDIRAFLGIQKWVFLYHKSQLILPFTIWPLLLFNKWYVWYGDKPIISDPQWRISWPIVTVGAFITIGLYLLRKIKHTREIEAIMAWSVLYILFFSIGQVTARYLVIYIPVLYLVVLYGVEKGLVPLLLKKNKAYTKK